MGAVVSPECVRAWVAPQWRGSILSHYRFVMQCATCGSGLLLPVQSRLAVSMLFSHGRSSVPKLHVAFGRGRGQCVGIMIQNQKNQLLAHIVNG